jgi:hypothetical protein
MVTTLDILQQVQGIHIGLLLNSAAAFFSHRFVCLGLRLEGQLQIASPTSSNGFMWHHGFQGG